MMAVLLRDFLILALAGSLAVWFYRQTRKEYLADAVNRLKRERRVLVALAVILVYFVVGLLDSILVPGTGKIEPASVLDLLFSFIEKERTYSAPFAAHMTGVTPGTETDPINLVKGIHILGTDVNGYDVMLKVLKGCRTALFLSFGSSLIAFPIGIMLGVLAGYFGGWLDDLIVWLYTTVASIPFILFVIAFLTVFGRDLFWICIAFGLTSWVGLARLIRGETLKHKSLDYITAARATGIPTFRILWRHLIPNLMHLVIITFSLASSSIILAESVLTFIGIGVEPGTDSWGIMLVEAQQELTRTPSVWWVFAGSSFVGILPLVLCLNIFGDALRDALDPRLRGEMQG